MKVFSEHVEPIFLDLSLHKSIFLCGDFNIDILKHNLNRGIKYFLDTMYAIGLYPLIDRPTCISNQSFSLIDSIFTNVTNYNITSGILINDIITDHLPVFAIYTYPNPNRQIKKVYVKKRIVNECNITTLIGNLTNICWGNVLNAVEFLSIFSEQYNICCPVKTIRAQVARRDKPWITNGLKMPVVRKTDCVKYVFNPQIPAAESRYKIYKNKLTLILRTAEKEHYSKLL